MAETEFKYDVFISYSHKDEEWVVNTLLPSLEDADLKVCIDFRDFVPGKPSRHNMRDACKASAYTVLVMTPAWMLSEWTEFEGLLTLLHDPSGNRQRTIPILLEKCDIPEDIQIFTYVDFTRRDREAMEWQRLLKACGTVGEFKLRRKKAKTPKDGKKTAQLILDGDYESFDEKTLVAALAGMLNVDRNHIRVLHTGKGSIVIDLELPAEAAHLLIKMALEKDVKLRTLGLRSVQLEGQKSISVTDTKDWFLAHPYPMPPNFTGRAAEQTMLDNWLTNDKDRLFILRALGGFGKSALTWQWINTHVNPAEYPKLVWWSFYEGDASFEHFIEETLKYLKLDVPQGGRPQVDKLLKAMQSQKILLIMDGFERALRAYSSMNAAYQADESPLPEGEGKGEGDSNQLDCVNINAEIFLKSICSLPNIKSKVLMTTRLTPRAIKPRGEFMLGCREEELTAMQKADAVEFFNKQKIKGTHAEIESACEPYGYHPLSLRILAGLITDDRKTPGDISVANKLEITKNIVQNKHHILEVAYNTLSSAQKKLLSTIACFRSPMTYETLKTISNKSSGKGKKAKFVLSEDLDDELRALEKRGLLHWDRKANKYDLHPIVRRYAYECLTAPDRTTAHTRLRDYFAALDVPEQPQTIEELTPVIELYYHTVRAGEFDHAVVLLEGLLPNPLHYRFAAYQLNLELLQVLFPRGEEFLPRLKEESAQGWTLGSLANTYSVIGQPGHAIPLHEKNIKLREKLGQTKNVAVSLMSIASQQIDIGILHSAESNLRHSIDLLIELGEEYRKIASLWGLAGLLAYVGRFDESKNELDKALKLSRDEKSLQSECVVLQYLSQCALLMERDPARSSTQNRKSAILYAQHALDLAEENARLNGLVERDFVSAHWLLGSAYRLNGQLDLAEKHLNEALTRIRVINRVIDEADILLDLARLRYDQKNYDEAKSLAEEALTITERCGYVLQGADVNLFLAQYALEQEKDKVKAKEYAEEARKLATCDGPPYYYKVAYEEAERFLDNL